MIGEKFKLALAITKKIGYQAPAGPEAKLMFAVFEMAIRDYFDRGERNRIMASRYLTDLPIPHLEILGIDSEWAMNQYRRAGIEITYR